MKRIQKLNGKRVGRYLLSGLVLIPLFFTACRSASVGPATAATAVSPTPAEGTVPGSLEGSRLRAEVTVRPLGEAGEWAADLLEEELREAALGNGLETGAGGASADVQLQADYRSKLFDQSGEYFLYEGTARAWVRLAATGEVVEQTRLQQRGPRALGSEQAEEEAVLGLAQQLRRWLSGSVTPQQLGLAASVVTVGRLGLRDAGYPATFTQRVEALPEVTAVRYLGQDGSGDHRFRVTYFTERLPEGLLTRLRGVDELRLN